MVSVKDRIVITGMGSVNALGNTPEEIFDNLCAGVSGITEITGYNTTNFKCKNGGEMKESFNANDVFGKLKLIATLAVDQALAQSGMLTPESRRVGLIVGTIFGGNPSPGWLELNGTPDLQRKNYEYHLLSSLGDELGRAFRLTGPRMTLCDACATGLSIMDAGMDLLRAGRVETVVCVGAELLSDFACCLMMQLRVLAKQQIRPFDLNRKGTILGEGAAAVVMELASKARERKTEVLAEIAGSMTGCEAFDLAAPEGSGAGMAAVMKGALAQAGLNPGDIDYINAHGTGTVLNDKVEAAAIRQVFGDDADRIPVSSTKAGTGHLCGAAGIAEAIISIMAILRGAIPPTLHYQTPDPLCRLNLVTTTHHADVKAVLTNSFGFGGNNAAMVLTAYRSPYTEVREYGH